MAEEEGTSSYQVSISQQIQSQQSPHQPILKWYSVAIVLVLLGFYFLIFATIQLVTNYGEHNLIIELSCSEYQCVGIFGKANFPEKTTLYMYLYNNHFTQNIIEGVNVCEDINIINCEFLATNAQMKKNVSLLGQLLQPGNLAYPCGPIAQYFPEFQLTLINSDTNKDLTVKSDDLSVTNYSFKNEDFRIQWTDVETSRYSVWSERQISMGIYKYWGYIEGGLSGNFKIIFQANNPLQPTLTNGLGIELTTNEAFNGYNISLCTFNFIWAFSMFALGCFSFYVIGMQNNAMKKIQPHAEKQGQLISSVEY